MLMAVELLLGIAVVLGRVFDSVFGGDGASAVLTAATCTNSFLVPHCVPSSSYPVGTEHKVAMS